jgi:serine protease Do/serine protease DegQ
MGQLAQFGEVRRGTLGLYVQNLTAELAGAFGVENGKGALVAEVSEGSAAEQAGIQAGDVITGMAGYSVNNAQEFNNLEGQFPVNEALTVEFVRDRATRKLTMTTEALRQLDGAKLDRRLQGVIFEELPLKLRSERIRGVLISDLEPGSLLARRGLRPGDVITGVNRREVRTLGEFEAEISANSGTFFLQIRRNGGDYVARID